MRSLCWGKKLRNKMGNIHRVIALGIEKEVVKYRGLGYGSKAIYSILLNKGLIKDGDINPESIRKFIDNSNYVNFHMGRPTQLYENEMKEVHSEIFTEMEKRIVETKKKRALLDKKLDRIDAEGIIVETTTKAGNVVKVNNEGIWEIKALIDSWAKVATIENKLLENLARLRGELKDGVTVNLVKVENSYNLFMSIVFDVLKEHKDLRNVIERRIIKEDKPPKGTHRKGGDGG